LKKILSLIDSFWRVSRKSEHEQLIPLSLFFFFFCSFDMESSMDQKSIIPIFDKLGSQSWNCAADLEPSSSTSFTHATNNNNKSKAFKVSFYIHILNYMKLISSSLFIYLIHATTKSHLLKEKISLL
jgi:hypothetical protein